MVHDRSLSLPVELLLCADNLSCVDPEGWEEQGVRTPPPEKSQNYRVLFHTAADPLKNHKATKPAFNAGPSLARQ